MPDILIRYSGGEGVYWVHGLAEGQTYLELDALIYMPEDRVFRYKRTEYAEQYGVHSADELMAYYRAFPLTEECPVKMLFGHDERVPGIVMHVEALPGYNVAVSDSSWHDHEAEMRFFESLKERRKEAA